MPLPSFIIAGERRSGTTTLAYYFMNEPMVFMHPHTDMAYFIDDELVGRKKWMEGEVDPDRWIQQHSIDEYANVFNGANGKKIVGEKSADYFFWQPAHKRMADFLPDTKFIVILRNPIDRAWSHYWNEVGKGREKLTFEKAIKTEEDRRKKSAYARLHLSYVRRGFYDESAVRFLKAFGEENVLFVTLESFKNNPIVNLEKIYSFLDLKIRPDLSYLKRMNKNWTTLPRTWAMLSGLRLVDLMLVRMIRAAGRRCIEDPKKRKSWQLKAESLFRMPQQEIKMKESTKQKLIKMYEPHVQRLKTICQKQISEWSEWM